jgi:hypothetical protein
VEVGREYQKVERDEYEEVGLLLEDLLEFVKDSGHYHSTTGNSQRIVF